MVRAPPADPSNAATITTPSRPDSDRPPHPPMRVVRPDVRCTRAGWRCAGRPCCSNARSLSIGSSLRRRQPTRPRRLGTTRRTLERIFSTLSMFGRRGHGLPRSSVEYRQTSSHPSCLLPAPLVIALFARRLETMVSRRARHGPPSTSPRRLRRAVQACAADAAASNPEPIAKSHAVASVQPSVATNTVSR